MNRSVTGAPYNIKAIKTRLIDFDSEPSIGMLHQKSEFSENVVCDLYLSMHDLENVLSDKIRPSIPQRGEKMSPKCLYDHTWSCCDLDL